MKVLILTLAMILAGCAQVTYMTEGEVYKVSTDQCTVIDKPDLKIVSGCEGEL